MKIKKTITLLLSLLLLLGLSGCGIPTLARQLDAAEEAVEHRLDIAENALENAAQTMVPAAAITEEQAQQIALEHAGFTADQVKYLQVSYELDDGIPQYEVRFHEGRWEYDYEIHAETGDILSYDRDD